MKARIVIEAAWTPHVDPDDADLVERSELLEELVRELSVDPESLAEFLDRDEVAVTVEGEWL